MQNQPGWNATFEHVPVRFPDGVSLKILSRARSELKSDPITVIHAHDQLEMGYCYSGSGIFLVEGQVHPFTEGAVTVFLPGQSHRAQSTPGKFCQWNFMWVDLKALLAPLPVPEFYLVHHPLFTKEEAPLLSDLMRSALVQLEIGTPADDPVVRGLLLSIAGILSQFGRRFEKKTVHEPPEGVRRIIPALDYIARHYAEDLSIPQLAKINGMSVTSFRRHFARAVGLSPLEYLTELRVQLGSIMLKQEGSSILETALALGYESPSTFYRHFFKLKGISPQKWKKKDI